MYLNVCIYCNTFSWARVLCDLDRISFSRKRFIKVVVLHIQRVSFFTFYIRMTDEQLNHLTNNDTTSIISPIKSLKGLIKEEQPWLVPFPLEHPKRKQNYIRTAKYTLLTFIPLQFYYQFSKSYNLYFLLAALTVFYGASSLSPVTQILPLVIVFTFSAGKEAIEDYSRSTSDNNANKEQYSVIRNGIIEKIDSMNITKGDIFYLEKGWSFKV